MQAQREVHPSLPLCHANSLQVKVVVLCRRQQHMLSGIILFEAVTSTWIIPLSMCWGQRHSTQHTGLLACLACYSSSGRRVVARQRCHSVAMS
jgi:hypothetical protein